MLSNRNFNTTTSTFSIEQQTKTYSHQLSIKLKKKVDLVIIYNLDGKATAIEESYLARIPTITFHTKLNILNKKTVYESPKNFKLINNKLWNNNFFFSIVETSVKKALRTKKLINKKKVLNKTFYN